LLVSDCICSSIPLTVQVGKESTLDVKGNNISTAPTKPLAAATCIGLTPSCDMHPDAKFYSKY